jgi:hypothetical protein
LSIQSTRACSFDAVLPLELEPVEPELPALELLDVEPLLDE